MKTHFMNLADDPFQKIACIKKTVEMRLFDEKRQKLAVGDKIVFTNRFSKETLSVKILALHRFPSFDDLYRKLSPLSLGYDTNNAQKADPADMRKYYSKEDELKYGVVGIEFILM